MKELQYINALQHELSSTNSANNKKEILQRFYEADPKLYDKCFSYIYDFDKKYFISYKQCEKKSNLVCQIANYKSIFELLDDLSNRVYTGYEAISKVNNFVTINKEYEHVIKAFIDKDLKVGTGTTTINKVSKCIKKFDVALGKALKDLTEKELAALENCEYGEYYISRKMDGFRGVTVNQNDNNICYSRGGNEFNTVDELIQIIRNVVDIKGRNFVLDGELCIMNPDGSESYKEASKQFTKKDYQVQNACYKLFDCLSVEEFTSKTSTRTFAERQEELKEIISLINSPQFEHLEQVPYTKENYEMMKERASKEGWEGLIIRKNTFYKGKKSKDIIKDKPFFDEEYPCVSTKNGTMPMLVGINEETGEKIMEEVPCLSAIVIQLPTGETVDVGSGFSVDQRLAYYEDPSLVVGHQIRTQFNEKTQDKHGNNSLRFPVYLEVRDIKY